MDDAENHPIDSKPFVAMLSRVREKLYAALESVREPTT
jgi:hypothetical protein